MIVAIVLGLSLLTAPNSKPAPIRSVDQTFTVYVGDLDHPVSEGDVWLFRHSYYGFDQANIGHIVAGRVRVKFDTSLMDPLLHIDDPRYDNTFVAAISLPGNQWYAGTPVAAIEVFSGFHRAMASMGTPRFASIGAGTTIVLATPARRTLIFERADGSRAARLHVGLGLFIGQVGHCAETAGPRFGDYITDSDGVVELHEPDVPIAVWANNYSNGWGYMGLDAGRGARIVVRREWGFKFVTWSVRLLGSNGTAVRHATVRSYNNVFCGAIEGGVTDAHGYAHVPVIPHHISWIEIVVGSKTHSLTPVELQQLEKSGKITIRWW